MALKPALSKTLLIEKSPQAWAQTTFNPEIILTNDTKQHLLLFRPCLLIQQLPGMVWTLDEDNIRPLPSETICLL